MRVNETTKLLWKLTPDQRRIVVLEEEAKDRMQAYDDLYVKWRKLRDDRKMIEEYVMAACQKAGIQ